MSASPPKHAGLRHAALFVQNLDGCVEFYTRLMGMEVEWQPDPDNYYLSSGNDNLALHRATEPHGSGQRLDHIGFIIDDPDDVDVWHQHMVGHGVEIAQPPKTHRDGARSFYCRDPDGTLVQIIFHPPISRPRRSAADRRQ